MNFHEVAIRKQIVSLILVGIVAMSAGVAIGFRISSLGSTASRTETSLVQASILSESSSSRTEWGSPQYVRFVNDSHGTFTATIDSVGHISNAGIFLPESISYQVQVWYLNLTAVYLNFDWHECIPNPKTILVSAQQQQFFNFTC